MANEPQRYTLKFVNNSKASGKICVYQKDPDIGNPNAMSLAWLVKSAKPTTTANLHWEIQYSFVWSDSGPLKDGMGNVKRNATFESSQTWTADLEETNMVDFQYDSAEDDYTFANQVEGPENGTLYVQQGDHIPPKMASVGVGMSGSGTFAVDAEPRTQATFTPHPEYWIDFGTFRKGQVMTETTEVRPQKLVFPDNVYSMTAVLGSNNKWEIHPTKG